MSAGLVLRSADGTVHPCLPGQAVVLGRENPSNPPHITIRDPEVAQHHCEVVAGDGHLRVVDCSKTGVAINGQRVRGEGQARPGDHIALSRGTVLRVESQAEGPPEQLVRHLAPRYQVRGKVGQGGMGAVYDALDAERQVRCAIKVLQTKSQASSKEARFQRESTLGARLREHPGIVAPYDFGELPSGEPYSVMEFVEGKTLGALVAGGAERTRVIRWVADVCRAVAHAHAQNVIHRDIKPANVLVTPAGEARLTDFGVAKDLDDIDGMTATGAVMGTLSYMAPEQIMDSKRVDQRSDVYALGATLYTAITRREPMQLRHLSLREALLQVLDTPIPAPRRVDASIDVALEAICLRAMAREPEHRPQTAGALADELEAWLGGDRTVGALPPDRQEDADAAAAAEGQESSGLAFLVILGFGVLVVAGLVLFALNG